MIHARDLTQLPTPGTIWRPYKTDSKNRYIVLDARPTLNPGWVAFDLYAMHSGTAITNHKCVMRFLDVWFCEPTDEELRLFARIMLGVHDVQAW